MKSKLKVRVGDMFSGAGGTATGCELALLELGLEPELLAVNHWAEALKVHARNHPRARHFPANVFRFDPREAVPTGKLDFLMASPTCSTFSRAKGGKPISWDQRYGRMTPRQVLRWCRELEPDVLLVENVPEFVDWSPLMLLLEKNGEQKRDKDGRPLWIPNRAKKGKHFRWWLGQLKKLGYRYEWRVLNCANFGDATTRKRFFLIARKDDGAIVWPEETHAAADELDADLFGSGKLPHRAARDVIRWEIRGRSIFDRQVPLAEKTLVRIYRGIVKFGWPAVFQVKLRLYMESLGIKVPNVVAAARATPRPLFMRSGMHKSNALCVYDVKEPLKTITTDGGLGVLEAGVVVLRNHADMRSVGEPLPTACAGGTHLGVAEGAFLFPMNQGKDRERGQRSVDEPMHTVVTKDMKALVEPFVLNRHGENGATRAHATDAPLPTATCRGAGYLVEPFVQANRSGNAAKSIDSPVPPVVTSGGVGLVEPFVLSQGAGGAPREVSESIPTVPTRGAHSLIAPYYGTAEARPADQPLPTTTTKARFGLVVPVTHHDESGRSRSTEQPLPTVTGASRGELGFISPAWGERKGQKVRVHSVDGALPTLCAKGRMPLVHGVVQADLDAVDILFRMLEPVELAASHSFPDGYFDDDELTKTEIIRMIGNSVPVCTARALVAAIFKTWRKRAAA